MRIVCLIQSHPALIYFVNRIHCVHPVSLVVVEQPEKARSSLAKIRRHGLRGSLAILRKRIRSLASRRRDAAIQTRYFGDAWKLLDETIPVLETPSINADAVRDRLLSEHPHVILGHGTSLVKAHIIDTAPLALNLHWGLSPYYRGSHCTAWALLLWDPYNIGVTIHKLTKQVDGGDVVAQARAMVHAGDSVHSINMQLTYLGTNLVVKALDRLKAGEELTLQKQDFSLGYLVRERQWTTHTQRQLDQICHDGAIEAMLEKPSRRIALPIVDL